MNEPDKAVSGWAFYQVVRKSKAAFLNLDFSLIFLPFAPDNVHKGSVLIRFYEVENGNHGKVAYAWNHIEVENIISFIVLAQ